MVNQLTEITYAGEQMHPIDVVTSLRAVGASMREVRGILIGLGLSPETVYTATYQQ